MCNVKKQTDQENLCLGLTIKNWLDSFIHQSVTGVLQNTCTANFEQYPVPNPGLRSFSFNFQFEKR